MIDGLTLGLGQLLMGILGQQPTLPETVPLVAWQTAKVFDAPIQADPAVEQMVRDYLKTLAGRGMDPQQQGVWLQSEWAYLGQHRETIPVSGASLTKVATTAAALERWGTEHRFETPIYLRGRVSDGVLQGDAIVRGGGDPLFVWEEAIALGNALNHLGIQRIAGNLIIVGEFAVNFTPDSRQSGEWLLLALDRKRWTPPIEEAYRNLPPDTPRPSVAIAGQVKLMSGLPPDARLALRHQSLPMRDLIRQMNIYSNNEMAEMLAQSVGGAEQVAQIASRVARVPPAEIQLINGSGLGIENRLSPRAVSQLFMALEEKLADSSVKVTDLFPVAGRDRAGTMQWRSMPAGAAIKTGTLNEVSALAGMIPTRERGPVWFTLINRGRGLTFFREEQDRFLQRLAQHWTVVPNVSLTPDAGKVFLGDPKRNVNAR